MKQYIKQRRDIKYLDFETNKFKTLEQYTFRGLQPSEVRYYRINTIPYKNINKAKYCNLGRGNIFKISTTLELGCNFKRAGMHTLHENLQLKPSDNIQGKTFEQIDKRKQLYHEDFIDIKYSRLEGIQYQNLDLGNVFYYNLVAQLNTQQFVKDGETYEQVGEKTYEVLNTKDYYPLHFVRNFKYYNIVNI